MQPHWPSEHPEEVRGAELPSLLEDYRTNPGWKEIATGCMEACHGPHLALRLEFRQPGTSIKRWNKDVFLCRFSYAAWRYVGMTWGCFFNGNSRLNDKYWYWYLRCCGSWKREQRNNWAMSDLSWSQSFRICTKSLVTVGNFSSLSCTILVVVTMSYLLEHSLCGHPNSPQIHSKSHGDLRLLQCNFKPGIGKLASLHQAYL